MAARLIVPLIAALAFATSVFAQDVKVEKYALDNGLTVILHEDHRLPIATINLWYRVGAKEEPPGRSGFAHLFEHLMFMGTQRVAGNDFDKIMEAGGGSNNASTALDRTNYFSSGPAELLPTLLWLDADRLEDLGRTMNQEKLDKQRDVVRNEIRQVVENSPYGKADEQLYRLLFPAGHPYHNAVYGTHEDLEAASVANVKDFFATFYLPNNCSLVVAGDFDSAKIKPLIQRLFGTLPKGGDVVHRDPQDWPAPVLGKVVRSTMLDKVDLPRITFSYIAPAWYAPGEAETRLAGQVLTDGKSSRLYKRLVLDDKLANDVSADFEPSVLASFFTISVMALPDADLTRIEKVVDEEIERLFSAGISPAELDQRKNRYELDFLSHMDSLAAVADQINEYQFAWGEPNSFKRDLDRYRNATPESVRDWARKVLTPGSRVIMRVLPEEPQRAECPRDKNPGMDPARDFSIPRPEEFTLDCGAKVLLWSKSDLPLVSTTMLLKPASGGALDPADKAGLTEITCKMIGEGAGDLDAIAFADAMQTLGARFGAGASHEDITVQLTSLKRTFPKAALLMGQAVRTPRMTDSDFERILRLHKDDLEQSLNDPGAVANNVAARRLFGDAHPYSRPIDGRVDTVSAISLADVKAAHAARFTPTDATVLLCGDISRDDARTALNAAFSGWTAAPGPRMTAPIGPIPATSSSGLRVFLVDRPEAVQTVIRFVAPGPKLADPARPLDLTINTILGGSFTSRLNQNIREDHGYAYGAGSRFMMQPGIGWFVASSSVKADVTGPALAEFFKEFDRIRKGDISEVELVKAVKTGRTETIQAYSTLPGVTSQAAVWLASGLPLDTPAADMAAQSKLTASDLNHAAGAAVQIDQGVLVLVGDRKLILEQIKALNLPTPVELSPEGTSPKPPVSQPTPARSGNDRQ